MSGLSEIKNKAKISVDEMYDIELVGKLDNQKKSKTLKQQADQPTRKQENQLNRKTDLRPIRTYTALPTEQQKIRMQKMTFNLTEEIYKAFNDLYAERILEGRKTDKSDMICEAIELFVKTEKKR